MLLFIMNNGEENGIDKGAIIEIIRSGDVMHKKFCDIYGSFC